MRTATAVVIAVVALEAPHRSPRTRDLQRLSRRRIGVESLELGTAGAPDCHLFPRLRRAGRGRRRAHRLTEDFLDSNTPRRARPGPPRRMTLLRTANLTFARDGRTSRNRPRRL